MALTGLEPGLQEKVKARLDEQRNGKYVEGGTPSTHSDTDLVAQASLTIAAACTGWKLGTVQRSQIMDMAKEIFSRRGYDPESVDWNRAIRVAVELDRKEGLGCLE